VESGNALYFTKNNKENGKSSVAFGDTSFEKGGLNKFLTPNFSFLISNEIASFYSQ